MSNTKRFPWTQLDSDVQAFDVPGHGTLMKVKGEGLHFCAGLDLAALTAAVNNENNRLDAAAKAKAEAEAAAKAEAAKAKAAKK